MKTSHYRSKQEKRDVKIQFAYSYTSTLDSSSWRFLIPELTFVFANVFDSFILHSCMTHIGVEKQLQKVLSTLIKNGCSRPCKSVQNLLIFASCSCSNRTERKLMKANWSFKQLRWKQDEALMVLFRFCFSSNRNFIRKNKFKFKPRIRSGEKSIEIFSRPTS